MIRNYLGRTVHLREKNGNLLTLRDDINPIAKVVHVKRVVGETPEGMELVRLVPTLIGLPAEEENMETGNTCLVPDDVFEAALILFRVDCYALAHDSAKLLPEGQTIMGSGLEYSQLLTPYDFDDEAEPEADEPVVVDRGGSTWRNSAWQKLEIE